MISGPFAAVAATLFLWAAASGLGGLVERWFPASLTGAERWALRLLGGAGLLGLLLFLMGLVRFTPTFIGGVCGGAGLLNAVSARAPVREAEHGWPSVRDAATWIVAGVLFLLALSALARPVGSFGDDGISYHLLGPSVWLRDGVIHPVLDHSHTAFPAVIETLYAAGLALANDRAPGLLGTSFALLLLGQLWGLAGRLGGGRVAAGLTVALAATMPVVMFSAEIGFVDIPYAALSLATARLAWEAERWREWAAAGVFGGLALGTKYTGILMLAVTLLVLVVVVARRSGPKRALGAAMVLGGSAALVGAPWYLKNLLLLGSPIYPPPPALAALFPGRGFSLQASENFEAYILDRGRGLGRGLLDLLLLPIRFTYQTHRFHGAGGIGIGPLALAPLGLLVSRRRPTTAAWGLWALLLTIVWFYTQQEARFLLHVIALLTVFAGVGGEILLREVGRLGRAVVWSALAVSVGYGALFLVKERTERIASVFSAGRAQQRWEKGVPFHQTFQRLNTDSTVGRVLIANHLLPPYYLRHPYLKVRGQYGEQPVPGIQTPNEALRHASGLGITHVWDVRYFGSDFAVEPNPCLSLVYQEPDSRVYRVRCQTAAQ